MNETIQQLPATKPDQHDVSTPGMLFNPQALAQVEHFSVQMAKGKSTLPAHLQGNPADCMAVAIQALQWGMNPYAVAQKTHLVNGTLGYEAQLVNAVVSSSNAIRGRFKYEWDGAGSALKCRAGAILAGESAITWGQWISKTTQTVQNSPLWKTDPEQQLAYLAVKKWARLYAPDVILGVYTHDELEDVPQQPVRDIGGAQVVDGTVIESRSESLKDKIRKKQRNQDTDDADIMDESTGDVITHPQSEQKQQNGARTDDPQVWDYDSITAALANCDDNARALLLIEKARAVYQQLDDVGKKGQLTRNINALSEELGI